MQWKHRHSCCTFIHIQQFIIPTISYPQSRLLLLSLGMFGIVLFVLMWYSWH